MVVVFLLVLFLENFFCSSFQKEIWEPNSIEPLGSKRIIKHVNETNHYDQQTVIIVCSVISGCVFLCFCIICSVIGCIVIFVIQKAIVDKSESENEVWDEPSDEETKKELEVMEMEEKLKKDTLEIEKNSPKINPDLYENPPPKKKKKKKKRKKEKKKRIGEDFEMKKKEDLERMRLETLEKWKIPKTINPYPTRRDNEESFSKKKYYRKTMSVTEFSQKKGHFNRFSNTLPRENLQKLRKSILRNDQMRRNLEKNKENEAGDESKKQNTIKNKKDKVKKPLPPQRSPYKRMFVRVKHDYESERDDEMTIKKGNIIKIVKVDENGWILGESYGKFGWFPAAFTDYKPTKKK